MESLQPIIIAIQKGSEKAEKQLFMATNSNLMAVALRYVIDKAAAKDVLQESYIRIFKNIASFKYESEGATFAWMRQITAREAIRWLKKQKRWQDSDTQVYRQEVTLLHPFFQDELHQCLLALSTEQRTVFNMFAIEGYKHQEIAQKLGIAVSSSRSLLSRARKELALQLEKNKKYAESKA